MSSTYDSAVIDVSIIEDERLLELPRDVRLLHIEGIVHSKMRGSDGAIRHNRLRRLTDQEDPEAAAAQLVRVGLWAETDGGWQILGWETSLGQMTAARVQQKRQGQRIRTDRYEKKQAANALSNAWPNAAASQPASRPARTPAKAGAGEGRDDLDAAAHGAAPVVPANEPRRALREWGRAVRTAPESIRKAQLKNFENRNPQYPADGREERNRQPLHPSMWRVVRGYAEGMQ